MIYRLLVLAYCLVSCASAQNNLEDAEKDSVVSKHSPILQKELNAKGLKLGSPIFVRVLKSTPEYPDYGVLEVWVKDTQKDVFRSFKTYPVCNYSGGLGGKKKQGDRKTPEGFYSVNPQRIKQNSSYHRAFNVGYPNEYDRAHDYTGSAIMIHGACVSIGCLAMTNEGIEEIWTLGICALRDGQPFFRVHIFPFALTDKNLKKHKKSEYYDFWKNLQEGYLYFEEKKTPPNVTVNEKKQYKFE